MKLCFRNSSDSLTYAICRQRKLFQNYWHYCNNIIAPQHCTCKIPSIFTISSVSISPGSHGHPEQETLSIHGLSSPEAALHEVTSCRRVVLGQDRGKQCLSSTERWPQAVGALSHRGLRGGRRVPKQLLKLLQSKVQKERGELSKASITGSTARWCILPPLRVFLLLSHTWSLQHNTQVQFWVNIKLKQYATISFCPTRPSGSLLYVMYGKVFGAVI